MSDPAVQPEQRESARCNSTLSAGWMALGTIVLVVVGMAAWIVLDVLPESRWISSHYLPLDSLWHGSPHALLIGQVRSISPTAEPMGPRWLADNTPGWYRKHMARLVNVRITREGWKPQELEALAGFDSLETVALIGVNIEALPVLPQVKNLQLEKMPVFGLDRFPRVESLTLSRPINYLDAIAIRQLNRLKKLTVRAGTDQRIIDHLRSRMPGLAIVESRWD